MNQFWDERYAQADYAYGHEPNLFFEEQLTKLTPGSILMPAEGEGRNAVFAAGLGWKVEAFDLSDEGKRKALALAALQGVQIGYKVAEFGDLHYQQDSFDAIGLIYAHFPTEHKSGYHQRLSTYLKPNGIVIFEAFSKEHLHYRTNNPLVGGPDNLGMLFSKEEILNDFKGFETLLLEQREVTLSEGLYHVGTGSVIRFVGRKLPTM